LTVVGINDTHGALLRRAARAKWAAAGKRSEIVGLREGAPAAHRRVARRGLVGKEPRWTQIGSSRRKQAGE